MGGILQILEDKDAPFDIRRKAYEIVCADQRIVLENMKIERFHDGATETDVIADLDMRWSTMEWEYEFDFSPFPEFSSWSEEQIRLAKSAQLPLVYVLIARMRMQRHEDPSVEVEKAKRAAMMLPPDLRVSSLIDVATTETLFGQDSSQTRMMIESLLPIVPGYIRIQAWCALARLSASSNAKRVEEYVRQAQEEIRCGRLAASSSVERARLMYCKDLVQIIAEAVIHFSEPSTSEKKVEPQTA